MVDFNATNVHWSTTIDDAKFTIILSTAEDEEEAKTQPQHPSCPFWNFVQNRNSNKA
jgi:hypothetical protein